MPGTPPSYICVFRFNDSEGRPLSGRHRYTLGLDLDDLPPVTAFWEMALYDSDGYFCDNAINRYALTSAMLDRGELHVAGRKLVIPVQCEAPSDPDLHRNWLPAPKGGFQLAMRLYGRFGPLIDDEIDLPQLVRNRSSSTWA